MCTDAYTLRAEAVEDLGRVAKFVEPLLQRSWQQFLNEHVQALVVEVLQAASSAPDWGVPFQHTPHRLRASS